MLAHPSPSGRRDNLLQPPADHRTRRPNVTDASFGHRPRSLDPETLTAIDSYWRAANYCSVGQIYLLDNPLLTEPLRPEHTKPRLLGHFGTTPGLNLIYAHLNRVIRRGTSI